MKDKIYIALGFGQKVRCSFKDYNGGVYDVYFDKGFCATSLNKTELEILVKILKLEEL